MSIIKTLPNLLPFNNKTNIFFLKFEPLSLHGISFKTRVFVVVSIKIFYNLTIIKKKSFCGKARRRGGGSI